MTFCALKQG